MLKENREDGSIFAKSEDQSSGGKYYQKTAEPAMFSLTTKASPDRSQRQ